MKRVVGLVAIVLASHALACGNAANTEVSDPGEDTFSGENAIVDVAHTPIENQSIGNCWIYAKATWAESMHLRATREAFDISQSYWTYWDWFEKLASGSSKSLETKKDDRGVTISTSISTGGSWEGANNLIRKYGIIAEGDFLPEDSAGEKSMAQARAEEAINASLTSGALSTAAARADKKLVRAELNKAFGLSDEVVSMLNRVFGEAAEKNLSYGSWANASGSKIINAKDFAVTYPRVSRRGNVYEWKTTLSEGMNAWSLANYPSSSASGATSRRAFQIRVQQALHASSPVPISWKVDFNARDKVVGSPTYGAFTLPTLKAKGPGRQGGHQTVLEDYEVKLSDGTVLQAGQTLDPIADKSKLVSALANDAELLFFRIKNSWGTTTVSTEGMGGYNDLYMDYLNGPIDWCEGGTDPTKCTSSVNPLGYVVLPPGF